MNNIVRPLCRADFRYFVTIPTRWSDNDMFGHLNNVIYNRFFETVVVYFMRERTPIDLDHDSIIPFAAETCCRFRKPLSYPETVEGGLRVEHVGTSSARYGIGLFRQGEDQPSADGYWVHVFVGRQQQRPLPIPEPARQALLAYM